MSFQDKKKHNGSSNYLPKVLFEDLAKYCREFVLLILWEDCKHIGSPAGLKISFYIFKDTSGFLPDNKIESKKDYHAHRTG